MPSALSVPNKTARLTAEHPGIVKLGRAGWLAKGIVYIMAGVLAIIVALKASGWSNPSTPAANQEASPTGAIKTVAQSTGGPLLLWILAIGLFVYAAWRVVSALLPGSADAHGLAKRVGYFVSAIIYTALGFSAIALSHSKATSPDGNQKVTDITAKIMSHTAGRLLVGVIAAVVIGVGIYRLMKGVKQDVGDELDLSGMNQKRARLTRKLGSIGEIGRGIGIGLIGFFLLRAAVKYNAAEATGLDGALRRLATQSWGVLVVAIVGIGFLAYGLFCATTFTHRRLQAP